MLYETISIIKSQSAPKCSSPHLTALYLNEPANYIESETCYIAIYNKKKIENEKGKSILCIIYKTYNSFYITNINFIGENLHHLKTKIPKITLNHINLKDVTYIFLTPTNKLTLFMFSKPFPLLFKSMKYKSYYWYN